ncbi:MAG TPA: branched-chain amino acid ABC transporter permease [Dehalococcoidales bacterium]
MKLGKNWGYILLIILAFAIPAFIQNDYYIYVLVLCAINIILTSSLRAVATSGQVSLGHAAFMGIGAYTSAILVMKLGFSPYLSLLLGGLVAMFIAAVIAYPITRVKTVYFSMLTMFFGVLITLIISEWRSVTNGTSGIIAIPPLGTISILGLNIDFNNKLPNYYFALIVMLIVLVFLFSLDRSYIGKTLKSISQDDALAASTGINVARYKVLIFCIGCFFAGLAGSLYGHFVTVIVPGSFSIFQSIYLLIYMIVGGTKRFGGPIIGAFVLTIIPELSRVFQEYQPFVFVAVLYLVVFLLPGGLVDLPRRIGLQFGFMNRGRARPYAGN